MNDQHDNAATDREMLMRYGTPEVYPETLHKLPAEINGHAVLAWAGQTRRAGTTPAASRSASSRPVTITTSSGWSTARMVATPGSPPVASTAMTTKPPGASSSSAPMSTRPRRRDRRAGRRVRGRGRARDRNALPVQPASPDGRGSGDRRDHGLRADRARARLRGVRGVLRTDE